MNIFKIKISFSMIILYKILMMVPGLPGSSAGKEATCNSGDPGLIPGLGRSTGGDIGYPLQYS